MGGGTGELVRCCPHPGSGVTTLPLLRAPHSVPVVSEALLTSYHHQHLPRLW